MSIRTTINLTDEEICNIAKIINEYTSKKSISKFIKDNKLQLLSYKPLREYSIVFYFKNFFIITFFDKMFLFNYSNSYKDYEEINNIEKYIYKYSIGLILDNKKLSDKDFLNLKHCYMLTKSISFVSENKIYCKYKPYHLIIFTLLDNTLKVTITANNSACSINMDNVQTDIKTFFKDIFKDVDENNLKIHHKILQYYSTLEET